MSSKDFTTLLNSDWNLQEIVFLKTAEIDSYK